MINTLNVEKIITPGRKLTGTTALVITIIAILFSLFELWINSIGVMPSIYREAVHLSFLLLLAFLLYPPTKKSPKDKLFFWDVILAVLGVAVGLYILLFEEEVHLLRGSVAITRDYIFATITVLLLLEAARRVVGPVLPGLSIFFLLYARFGPYFPGIFGHRGIQWSRILYRLYLTDEGIFGLTLTVSSTFIFMFILFGSFLEYSTISEFFNDFSIGLMGKRRGGPAQVAVISSGFMGTISGSAVANVATTGVFTIPMMKKLGYDKNFAGAVEAAASTGGQLMPPIMGAAAFIMSAYLGVPYIQIAIAAIIPAILYYLGIIVSVDLEARKTDLKGLPDETLPNVMKVVRDRGYLVIPVLVVFIILIVGRTPVFAAYSGIVATIIVSWFKPSSRMGLHKILKSLETGAKTAVTVGIACACCGFIVGVAAMTGVGSTVAYNIFQLSYGSIFIALILIMLASIVISMGLPSTACYIVVATVAAPALIEMGILPIAAHFFVFYFGCLSNLTPPVALASYTAAGISGGSPSKVAWLGLKLALAGFIIPYLYTLNPILLLQGKNIFQIMWAVITAILGVFILAVAAMGYLKRNLLIYERIMFLIAALLLAIPGIATDGVGFALAAVAWILNNYYHKKIIVTKEIE